MLSRRTLLAGTTAATLTGTAAAVARGEKMSATSTSAEPVSRPRVPEGAGRLTIDLSAIAANWRALAGRVGKAECSAAVKADAYGCGTEQVVGALAAAGCRTFFVAHLSEARRARATAPQAAVYVLNGLPPGAGSVFAEHDLRPVLSTREELDEWAAFRAASGWKGDAALHVDTGMNRLGLAPGEAEALAKEAGKVEGIALVMTHFANADNPAHPLNARQIDLFRRVMDLFPGIPGSLANSSGIFLGPETHHAMVRPGAALYGVNPTPGHANPMQTVARLEVPIIQVRKVDTGEAVGYGSAWTARRPSRIAVLAMGYADGFPRSASSSDEGPGADVIVAGRRCPLAGRVSMDLIAVDVTDLPGNVPARGDMVTVLDETIGVDELASHAGTIGYEVLTRLGHRYRRVYADPNK